MNTENLTGKYFGIVTKWDNSVMNLDFEDSLEQKRIHPKLIVVRYYSLQG